MKDKILQKTYKSKMKSLKLSNHRNSKRNKSQLLSLRDKFKSLPSRFRTKFNRRNKKKR